MFLFPISDFDKPFLVLIHLFKWDENYTKALINIKYLHKP